ncbi:MAG: metallophosphoesterase [Ruminococcaceae bacterium]|nr:metallophosphoesterase [Oscillospiraceae bacterium]
MRAIVISDSHNDTAACERAISSVAQYDMIIHLGDIARDVDFLESCYYPAKVFSVLGNNDFLRPGDYERVIDFDGHKIFICHGHTLSVNYGTEKMESVAKQKGCVAALFGHTHRSVCKKSEDGFLILNPGSVSRPRGCKPSFAILESDGGKLDAAIVDWVL